MVRNGTLRIRDAFINEGLMGIVLGILLWTFKSDLSAYTEVNELAFAVPAVTAFVWGISKVLWFTFRA